MKKDKSFCNQSEFYVHQLEKQLSAVIKERDAYKEELSELCLDPAELCRKVGDFTIVAADFEKETITLQKSERFEKDWAKKYGSCFALPMTVILTVSVNSQKPIKMGGA